MVFVSLEGFLDVGAPMVDINGKRSSSTHVPVPHAEQLPQAPVHVVVTPGSPGKPAGASANTTTSSPNKKRSRLRRAASSFSSLSTLSRSNSSSSSTASSSSSSPADVAAITSSQSSLLLDQFVVYVTDRDVHHKWVLPKTPTDYLELKKSLQSSVGACSCRKFACCGPLRRILASSQYKRPKRRWSDSRVTIQFVHCNVMQEFLNDLLLAVLRRDEECEATQLAWDALSAFLDVERQRTEVADKILLRTIGGNTREHDPLRRSLSDQGPPRRASIGSNGQCPLITDHTTHAEEGEQTDGDAECPICCSSLSCGDNHAQTSRLLCGHQYHTDCVRVWLRMQHTCPVCRIPIEGM